MVYVDEKGKEYEFQYCVVLEKGKDAGLRQYKWVSKKQIEKAMQILGGGADSLSLDSSVVETTFNRNPNINASFDKNRLGSLLFLVYNEELANYVAEKTDLPFPFPEKNY